MSQQNSRQNLIMLAVDDSVEYLLGYGRAADDDLPENAIAEAVTEGDVDVDDMVKRFRMRLCEELGVKL